MKVEASVRASVMKVVRSGGGEESWCEASEGWGGREQGGRALMRRRDGMGL